MCCISVFWPGCNWVHISLQARCHFSLVTPFPRRELVCRPYPCCKCMFNHTGATLCFPILNARLRGPPRLNTCRASKCNRLQRDKHSNRGTNQLLQQVCTWFVFEVMVINVSVAAMAIMTPSPGIHIELDGRSQVCAMLAQELKLITSI